MSTKVFKTGIFQMDGCHVIVSIDPTGLNGKWHLSISRKDRMPSYEEIKKARYEFIPNNHYMAQIFPPKEEFVNIHPYCHHLWEI